MVEEVEVEAVMTSCLAVGSSEQTERNNASVSKRYSTADTAWKDPRHGNSDTQREMQIMRREKAARSRPWGFVVVVVVVGGAHGANRHPRQVGRQAKSSWHILG